MWIFTYVNFAFHITLTPCPETEAHVSSCEPLLPPYAAGVVENASLSAGCSRSYRPLNRQSVYCCNYLLHGSIVESMRSNVE